MDAGTSDFPCAAIDGPFIDRGQFDAISVAVSLNQDYLQICKEMRVLVEDGTDQANQQNRKLALKLAGTRLRGLHASSQTTSGKLHYA